MGVLELTALPRETAYAGASAGSMVVTPNFGDEDTRVDFLF